MFSVAAFHLVIMFLSLSKEENKKMSRWITSDDLTTTLTFSLLCVWLLCISEWYRMNFVQYFSHIKQTNNQKCVAWCWKSVHKDSAIFLPLRGIWTSYYKLYLCLFAWVVCLSSFPFAQHPIYYRNHSAFKNK